MLCRNDNPYRLFDFNFAVDSVFTDQRAANSGIQQNDFLLLDSEMFYLLDGTNLLLLGT